MSEYESRLMEDIKTVDEFGSALVVRQPDAVISPLPFTAGLDADDVAAVEQGRREHPDGTVESYQRVEFKDD